MLKTILIILALTGAAVAQCPDPNWEYPSCQVTDWACYADESCFFIGGYFSEITISCSGYDPGIGQFNSCSYNYGGCTNSCIPPNASTTNKSFNGQFDPVRMVMNLWDRYQAKWLPVGTRGSCNRVMVKRLMGPQTISRIKS